MFGDRQKTIGIIGLGIIGSRIAAVLREAKWHVYVWNRSPKTEPNFVASPAEMAELTQTVQIFVSNGEALLETIDAMLPKLSPQHTVINSSTVALEDTRRAADLCEKTGSAFLDCPFTGSKEAAAAGELCYYVAGDPRAYDAARPFLEPGAREMLFLGETGTATVLKIATNMVSATTVEALAEALAVVRACGVDPATFEEAMAVNACRSGLTQMKVPSMLAGDYEAHFSLKHMFKDAQFALDLASENGVELPALSSTAAAMLAAIGAGHGERDYSALALNFPGTPDAADESGGDDAADEEGAAEDEADAAPEAE